MEKPILPPKVKGHGQPERGLDDTPRSRLYRGRFGRLFRSLPPADFAPELLAKLAVPADAELKPAEAPADAKELETIVANKEPDVKPETEIDDEENFGLPAGYTYFGQFIDHDITFDPLSSLVKRNDPDGLTNFRTPALDLDSVYGGGPDDQPYMYEGELTFVLGERRLKGVLADGKPITIEDLPRFNKRALIGDKRNDENVIVSQLHGLFLRFHNWVAEDVKNALSLLPSERSQLQKQLAREIPSLTFREVQRLVRWHYQWLVLFDYLPRIVGRELVEKILPHIKNGTSIYDDQPQLHFFNYRNDPFMPVEFSGAAYRFGHSMVRPVYRLSAFDFTGGKYADLDKIEGLDGRKLLFSLKPELALNGFDETDENNGIDWRLFFETDDHPIGIDKLGKGRVQPAYKIDSSLVNPLAILPEHSKPYSEKPKDGQPNTNNLAFRNLQRGVTLQLPSGQSVARLMGLEPIPDERLLVGKATADNLEPDLTNKSGINLRSIIDIDERFTGKAPLWFYILAEAVDEWRKKAEILENDDERNAVPTTLGPVGGRIVAEVLIGLILGDNDSFLSMAPNWKPLYGNQEKESLFDQFTMGHLIELLSVVD